MEFTIPGVSAQVPFGDSVVQRQQISIAYLIRIETPADCRAPATLPGPSTYPSLRIDIRTTRKATTEKRNLLSAR